METLKKKVYGTSQARIGEEDDDEEEAEDHIGPELHVIKKDRGSKRYIFRQVHKGRGQKKNLLFLGL